MLCHISDFRQLSLDPNTAGGKLSLSDGNTRVMVVEEKQSFPDQPQKCDTWKQLLCTEGLTTRCYWEVQWEGRVNVGVTYGGIKRGGVDSYLGKNDRSWSLLCSPQGFTAWHNNKPVELTPPAPSDSNRVGVYLDWSAGTVSFYCFSSVHTSRQLIHLHTFCSTFTDPLYPAFGFDQMCESDTDSSRLLSSVYLPQIEEGKLPLVYNSGSHGPMGARLSFPCFSPQHF